MDLGAGKRWKSWQGACILLERWGMDRSAEFSLPFQAVRGFRPGGEHGNVSRG